MASTQMTQLSIATTQKVQESVHAGAGAHVQVNLVGEPCVQRGRGWDNRREGGERERQQWTLFGLGNYFEQATDLSPSCCDA